MTERQRRALSARLRGDLTDAFSLGEWEDM